MKINKRYLRKKRRESSAIQSFIKRKAIAYRGMYLDINPFAYFVLKETKRKTLAAIAVFPTLRQARKHIDSLMQNDLSYQEYL